MNKSKSASQASKKEGPDHVADPSNDFRDSLREIIVFVKERWLWISIISVAAILLSIFWSQALGNISDAVGFLTQIVTAVIAVSAWLRFKKWEHENRLGHAVTRIDNKDLILVISLLGNDFSDTSVLDGTTKFLKTKHWHKGDGRAFCARFKEQVHADDKKFFGSEKDSTSMKLECLTMTSKMFKSRGIYGLSISGNDMPLNSVDIPDNGTNDPLISYLSNFDSALGCVENIASMVNNIHIFYRGPIICGAQIFQRFKNSHALYVYHFDKGEYLPAACLSKGKSYVLGTREWKTITDAATKS